MEPATIVDGWATGRVLAHYSPSSSVTTLAFRRRSCRKVVRSRINIKAWLVEVPDVDLVRPSVCLECGCAARPVGGCLGLHGHGLRERQVRGPPQPGFRSKLAVIEVRRYACQHCGAVLTVVPSEVEPTRWYSRPAIAWALALFGVCSVSSAAVEAGVSAWGRGAAGGEHSWVMLRRWCRAVRERRLFAQTRRAPEHWSNRQLAERVATTLAALCPPAFADAPLDHQAWYGAAQLSDGVVAEEAAENEPTT